MNEFEKYFDSKYSGYTECNKNMLRGVAIDAFVAGMLRAAEIAESKEGSWADLEWNEAVHDIAASIRKEAEDEHNNN